MPFEPETWLADRKARMADAAHRLARSAKAGAIPGGSIEDSTLKIDRLTAAVPEEADALVLDLYGRLPEVRVTDLLLEVNAEVGFTEAFTHLRTGAPCKDRLGLLNVLLAEGLNLGLSKMAGATNTHDFFQLSRLSRWHVESEAMARALATVIEGQSVMPMARFWGAGQTASRDGQFFPTTRQDGLTGPPIFGTSNLVHTLSPFTTLEPGDVVTARPPPGVGLGMTRPVDLLRAAGDVGTTILHPVGTTKTGTDPMAEVDPGLRLRGLRIAGAAVMPTLTSGNMHAPVTRIAEKAADMSLHHG